jgi:glycosyltransferase involved in cell wall biosynthesis
MPESEHAVPGRGRVAMLMPSLAGGGAERIFIEIARGLLALDFDVDIVVVREEGPLLDAIPAGARLVGLDASRTAFAGRSLRRYLARERPVAVISALDPTNALNVVVTRLVRSRIPSIVTQHNTVSMVAANATRKRERVVIAANRRLFARASRVVAVSGGVADDMADTLHLDRDSIDVIYNPVISPRHEVEGSAPVTHPWLRDKIGPVLLAVGRLVPAKDFPTLIRAVAELPEDHRLILLGDGEGRADLVELARTLGAAHRIDVHGFVANPFPFFAGADVLVLSSRWEGLPTVLIEALPFRCGIVATDCPSGPREILDGGRWGRLVPCGDPVALAVAIRDEIAHPRVRPRESWSRYELDHAVGHYARLVDELRTEVRQV